MGVSQVNNANIVKLALAKKEQAKRTSILPAYMLSTGSIFQAPNPNKTDDITTLNTKRSIDDLKNNRNIKGNNGSVFGKINDANSQSVQPVTAKKEDTEASPDVSVSGGKKLISEGEDQKSTVEKGIKDAQSKEKIVNKFANSAERLDGTVVKNDKKFISKYNKDKEQVEKDNQKILKLIKENDENEQILNDAQRELDQIFASNSTGTKTNINGRVGELQQIIGAKVGLMQANGKTIYSLRRNQSRHLSRMSRTQNQYIKQQNRTEKNIQAQQKETNGVIDFAQEVEKWSAIATAGGQALSMVGKLLVAAGMAAGFGFGAALISVGTFMQKFGTVVELVGQYGQTAANLTKTAAYAAEGNLLGAMTSTAAAIASGTAAMKGTKNLKNTFGEINNQAEAATQKIAAKAAAKEAVESMSEEELGGMSKKQARKFVTADLQKQMQDGTINVKDLGYKGIKEQIDNSNVTEEALVKAKTAYTNAQNTAQANLNITSLTPDNNSRYVTNTVKNNGDLRTISQGKFDRATNRAFRESIDKIGAKKIDFNIGTSITTLGNNVQNIASVLMTNETVNNYSQQARKKPVPPGYLDARTLRIMEKNQKYRAARGYAI